MTNKKSISVADLSIDLCGLNCPLPILRTKKALASLQSGQVLAVTATDPSTMVDFKQFCQQTGHVLFEQNTRDGAYYDFLIRCK